MRLWHQSLLPYLDDKRLLSQHRECCALRGKEWGKKHSVVDYVFKYDLAHLYQYHLEVICEMARRNFKLHDYSWMRRTWRGKELGDVSLVDVGTYVFCPDEDVIYKEHDNKYLRECLLNLKAKGAELKNGITIDEWLIKLDLESPFKEER